jgi:mono/diheme cytochrome c family protein
MPRMPPMPPVGRPRSRRRIVLIVVGVIVVVFGLLQLVPYRVDNPPVQQGPKWDSARTLALARAACFDCHSNETRTQWWEDVAPGSWWITNHVRDGREALNFSECTGKGGEAGDASETVRNASMPPGYYTWFGMHANAKLSASQRKALADGLSASLRNAGCGGGG